MLWYPDLLLVFRIQSREEQVMGGNGDPRRSSGGRRARLGAAWSTLVGADSRLGRVAWRRPETGPGARRRTTADPQGLPIPVPESPPERPRHVPWGLVTILAILLGVLAWIW